MAVYAYKMVEATTGLLLGELPLHAVRYERLVSSAGKWSARVALGDSRLDVLDIAFMTEPNCVELVIERDGEIAYCGFVTGRGYSSTTQVLSLNGREPWCYFDRRQVEWDVTYANVDQGLIAADLLARAAASPFGDFRVDLGTTAQLSTGVTRNLAILANDTKYIAPVIQDLAALDNGFEFILDAYWSSSGGLSVLRHLFRLGYPLLGARGGLTPSNVWSIPGSTESYTWDEEGSGQVNEIFGIGDDGGGGVRITRAKVLPDRQPLLQGTASLREIAATDTVAAAAKAAVTDASTGALTARIQVPGDQAPVLGTYGLGDDALLVFEDPRFRGAQELVQLKGWEVGAPDSGQHEDVILYTSLESPDQLVAAMDHLAQRLRYLETHSLGQPFVGLAGATYTPVASPPPPPTTTQVVVDIAIPATGLLTGAGVMLLASASFTLAKAGTIVVEGQIKARMEAWDNYVAAPRREGWVEASGVVASAHKEWPFGIATTTNSFTSASTAIGIGTYTAAAKVQLAGFNQMRVYGGWLRVTWTG